MGASRACFLGGGWPKGTSRWMALAERDRFMDVVVWGVGMVVELTALGRFERGARRDMAVEIAGGMAWITATCAMDEQVERSGGGV